MSALLFLSAGRQTVKPPDFQVDFAKFFARTLVHGSY
jgi:hypothetical protein